MKSALVLCSGGIDSVVTAYLVRKQYKAMKLVFFDYGQTGKTYELDCVQHHAHKLRCPIDFLKVTVEGNSLIQTGKPFKKVGERELKNTQKISKQWYVPCRNLLFLSYALSHAESTFIQKKEKSDIFIGLGSEGSDTYPDASSDFIEHMNRLSHHTCLYPFPIKAPLIKKNKEDIIGLGSNLGVDFSFTRSCYASSNRHCGVCLACALRKHGFYWANLSDPTLYLQ